jgi:predicted MFS family arabinose efflux permease
MGIAFYFLISVLPIYVTDEMKADKSVVGLVLSMYTIAALFIRPFSGIAVDSIGRKVIYIWSFLIFSILFGLYGFVTTVFIMAVLRFSHGLAWGVTSTSGTTLAVDIIPPSRRGEGIGYFGLAMTLSMAIGPAIGLWLSRGGNYDRMFIAGFLLSLAGFILLLFIKYPEFIPHEDNTKFKWKNLIETKSLIPGFNVLLTQITYGGLLSFIALYGKEIGIANPGLFFVIYAGGLFLGRSFSGRIFDREGPLKVVSGGLILIIIGFLILALEKNYYGYLGAGIVMGLGNGIALPAFQAMVNNMVEVHRRGAANSTYYMIFDLGIGVGMALIGLISELSSISFAFVVCSGICTLALIYFLIFVLKYYRKNKLNVD